MSEEVIKVVSQIFMWKVKATQAPIAHHWPFWGVFKGNTSWFLSSHQAKGRWRQMKKDLTFVKSPTFSIRFLPGKREGQMSCFLFPSQGSLSPRTPTKVSFSFPGLHFRLGWVSDATLHHNERLLYLIFMPGTAALPLYKETPLGLKHGPEKLN